MVYQQVGTNQFENTCENICGAEYKKLFLGKKQAIVGYTDERYSGCYDGDVENSINISHVTIVVDIIADIPMSYRQCYKNCKNRNTDMNEEVDAKCITAFFVISFSYGDSHISVGGDNHHCVDDRSECYDASYYGKEPIVACT